MPHLLPMPPPANHQDASITSFSIGTESGRGELLAWGADVPGVKWRVGTEDPVEVVSIETKSPYSDLKLFEVRGVKSGQKLALFINRGQGWTRHSPFITCASNSAQIDSVSKGLPRSKHNKFIVYYPFGAEHACQPIRDQDFVEKLEAAFEKIKKNVVGKTVLDGITSDLYVYPYLPCEDGANSSLRINPAQWDNNFKPGAGLDEVLLHELIHVVEQRSGDYQDRYGFAFDKTDFLTVNATNVYSCMNGRGLRKDHFEFMFLPSEHFKDPKLHFTQQEPNYKLASASAVDLIKTLKTVQGVWNPFRYLS